MEVLKCIVISLLDHLCVYDIYHGRPTGGPREATGAPLRPQRPVPAHRFWRGNRI